MNNTLTRRLSIKLLSVIIAVLVIHPVAAELPQIGDPASVILTPEEEYSLRRFILADLRNKLDVVEDAQLNYYVNNLGTRLTSVANNVQFPFQVVIVNSRNVNAFALPSGIIALNRGLIDMTESEAELVAVLAHEIAHVTQRHIARFYQKSKGLTLQTALGTLAAIIAASYSPEVGQAALMTTLAASQSKALSFTRDNEREADRIGREIMLAAGYSPKAMQSFFAKLKRNSLTDSDKLNEFLQTHPLPDSRIADAMLSFNQEDDFIASHDTHNSTSFELAKARLKALYENQTDSLSLVAPGSNNQHIGSLYLKAIRQLKNDRTEASRSILRQLPEVEYSSLPFRLLLVDVMVAEEQLLKAEKLLTALLRLYPDHPAVIEKYASVLILNAQYQQAWNLLNQTTDLQDIDINLLKIKADAASKMNKPANSHESMAEYYYYSGQTKLALEHIKIALDTPGISKIMLARLEQNVVDLTRVIERANKKDKH